MVVVLMMGIGRRGDCGDAHGDSGSFGGDSGGEKQDSGVCNGDSNEGFVVMVLLVDDALMEMVVEVVVTTMAKVVRRFHYCFLQIPLVFSTITKKLTRDKFSHLAPRLSHS